MNVVTLENYELLNAATGSHLQDFSFSLKTGETCSVTADNADNAHLLASALATLVYPVAGKYIFEDEQLDFRSYRNLLECKKRIGYFGPEAAMVSNLTLRQNLLLSRTYFENTLDLDLEDRVLDLCSAFHLTEKLDLRPTALSALDTRAAIMAREIAKPLKILIMDSPEDLIGHPGFNYLVTEVERMTATGIPLVLLCENAALTDRLTDRTVRI